LYNISLFVIICYTFKKIKKGEVILKIRIGYILSIMVLLNINILADSISTSFESFDFTNSKKKDKGNRYNIAINHKEGKFLWQIYYSKTRTDTFQPPSPTNLRVDKLYFKGSYNYNKFNSIYFGYATIDDNLMKSVDGGNVYNIGYRYKNIKFNQYFSNYSKFNVYQSDINYKLKYKFDNMKVSINMAMRYIHLKDKDSDKFSQNAQDDYLNGSLHIHLLYPNFFIGSGVVIGKRAFAIMKNGFRIQHHAMEFDKTYQFGIGKKWDKIETKLMYVHQEATELPIMNKNVELDNVIFELKYLF